MSGAGLVDIWIRQRKLLEDKAIEQVTSMPGAGTLDDGSQASEQFRGLLVNLPLTSTARHVDEGLSSSFRQS